MYSFKLTSVFVLLYFFTFSQQEETNYINDYISSENGLSHNFVTSIVSDNLNNKWIGTENGITKYNGYDFEYIRPSLGYPKLYNENIEVLFHDRSNNIWIGTKSGGLSCMDVEKNAMFNYNKLIDPDNESGFRIKTIEQAQNGNIWVGTWSHGVYVISPEDKKLIFHYEHSTPIYGITSGLRGDMWYSAGVELIKYNGETGTIENFKIGHNITYILFDAYRSKVWIGDGNETSKLYFYDYQTDKIGSIETGVRSTYRKTLSIDADHRIWIGTWTYGLYRSNKDLSQFDPINIVPANARKIRQNYSIILTIHHDKNGQSWIGTANAGVVKIIEAKPFHNAARHIQDSIFKGDLNINSIYALKDRMFIGTSKSGLLSGPSFSDLRLVKGVIEEVINCMYLYDNKLYVGSNKSFSIYDLIKNKVTYNNTSIKKASCFFIDQEKKIYLGTHEKGLYVGEINKEGIPEFHRRFSDNSNSKDKIESDRITSIQEDQQGNIWVATYNGLHLFDKKNSKLISQNELLKEKLPSVIINTMLVKNGEIWVGTPAGLILLVYNAELNELNIKGNLTTQDGLNNDFICSLTSDANDNLWMSTYDQIVKYSPKNNSFVAYDRLDGVGTNGFNNRSFFNFSNETIYFGGMDNITYFNPNMISTPLNVPEVIFSQVVVNNKILQYGGENEILNKVIGYADKLTLASGDRFFSINFVVNDFLGRKNLKYRYKLNGYQEDWIDLQSKNEINFASLPAGNYKLEVQATRDNQNWSAPNFINIIVKKSPWLSYWAVAIYTLIIFLAFYYYIKFKKNQLILKADLEITKIEKEKDYALNEAKLNFFTNISHEFRTPLTLILSPLQGLLSNSDLDEKYKKKLGAIERNATKLLNLITQLLDFRKAESGLLKVNASQGNFVRFSREVFLYFTELASERRVKYDFECEVEEINFPFDRNKMEIVLCNLISNALKYCNPGDKITFNLYEHEGFCFIKIRDTGIGINDEDLDKIFDRFFQIKNAQTSKMVGSGIGLAFSKKIVELHHGNISVTSNKNKGAEFCVKINMDSSVYKNEIDENFINTDNIEAYDAISSQKQIDNFKLSNWKSNSILIIDDNAEILSYLRELLEEEFQIFAAKNGEVGYDIATREIPDLIISDVMMPIKDGITLCKELKSQIRTSHIPIILLTARSSTVYELEGLQTGADDYIKKPFNPTLIKARIASLLENRNKTRDYFANKVRFEPSVQDVNSEEDSENLFIQKAMNLVEKNISDPNFGIETLMDELNMSQSTLYRKIKSLTGLSLSAFIRSVRLKKAATLIITSDLNLNQIAFEIGINDYKYFTKKFRSQFGCLPSAYKKKSLEVLE